METLARTRRCSVEGCHKRHLAKGYCSLHYYRVREYGEPGDVLRQRSNRGVPTKTDDDAVFRFIVGYSQRRAGLFPTYREIAGAIGATIGATVPNALERLKQRGLLRQGEDGRYEVAGARWVYDGKDAA